MSEALIKALAGFGEVDSTKEAAKALFNELGYKSERTLGMGDVEELIALLDDSPNHPNPLTSRQRELFCSWSSAEIVFQLTPEEISDKLELSLKFADGEIKSIFFVVADLEGNSFRRSDLVETACLVNRLPNPAIILFRHGKNLTLSTVSRRPHKRDSGRFVLDRVTLIKDICFDEPHRAHVDILTGLALPQLMKDGVRNFEELHRKWEEILDAEKLSRSFYRKLYKWFQWAVETIRAPGDDAKKGLTEHVIRLITRLLFIWFMREKGLIPEDLFEEDSAKRILKNYRSNNSNYYRAVLQNLFFATLNVEIKKRVFDTKAHKVRPDLSKFQHRDLLVDPKDFLKKLRKVPFVNGGLFDHLDDNDKGKNQERDLKVPAKLFFDKDHGLFPLLRKYKFTVEENTPLDQEVALDPELLGLVFENLLSAYNPETQASARKATGSYYTPRRVVDYMARKVLADALEVKVLPDNTDRKDWRERLEHLFDSSDAMNEFDKPFGKRSKRALVDTIAKIRILDPAVGSGAFPVAILRALTMALRRLDPDNSLWRDVQKKRVEDLAEKALGTKNHQRRDVALQEIKSIFENTGAPDFARKLYLIQNGIYGVDIQPIACQIAKLRFFISLIIEQEVSKGPEFNYGIRPLPNLETRFVSADTLMKLGGQKPLRSDYASRKIGDLRLVRERYFNAQNSAEKSDLQKIDQDIREALAGELLKLDFGHDSAQAIADWDPYDQTTRADWFDPKWMFGVADGFDVVIGNPPYIPLQRDDRRLAVKYKSAGYKTFVGNGDIYQLFYERGCDLLKSRGVLTFITSNSWLRAKYGKLSRQWFANQHTPLRLVEMGENVFDASVEPAILWVREGGKTARLPAVSVECLNGATFPPSEGSWAKVRLSGTEPWRILSSIESGILDKMKDKGTPLRDWNVQIGMGIKTGYNKAFIINAETKTDMIGKDPCANQVIKPVLRGRDIHRWQPRESEEWLIYSHSQIKEFDYPSVREHLLPHKENLLKRGGVNPKTRRVSYEWWQLQQDYYNAGSYQAFEQEKLFWPDISKKGRGRFVYSETEIYCEASGFVMTGGPLKYLCAVLNSAPIAWRVSKNAPTLGKECFQWKKHVVESLPIPQLLDADQRWFIQMVDRILEKKYADPNADIRELEEKIDQEVYKLYELTDKEIKVIQAEMG